MMLRPPALRRSRLGSLFLLVACLGFLRESLLRVAPALVPVFVLVRLEERIPDHQRLSASGFAACLGLMVALTLGLYWHTGLRTATRRVNLGNFVTMRLLPNPAARQALVELRLPRYSRRRVSHWVREYSASGHLSFLATHPVVAFDLFRQTSLAVTSRIGTNEQYRWYPSARNRRPDTVLLGVSYLATRLVCLPVLALGSVDLDLCLWLPVVLLVVLGMLNPRLGGMRVFPALLVLAPVLYSQYLVTALFEGTEDHRHALVGSEALVCFYWLATATGVATWREWRRGAEPGGA
jgi:hypothetical protein